MMEASVAEWEKLVNGLKDDKFYCFVLQSTKGYLAFETCCHAGDGALRKVQG